MIITHAFYKHINVAFTTSIQGQSRDVFRRDGDCNPVSIVSTVSFDRKRRQALQTGQYAQSGERYSLPNLADGATCPVRQEFHTLIGYTVRTLHRPARS